MLFLLIFLLLLFQHWPELRAVILVVSDKEKDTSSTSGMETSRLTSPLLQFRASSVVQKVGLCACFLFFTVSVCFFMYIYILVCECACLSVSVCVRHSEFVYRSLFLSAIISVSVSLGSY